MVSHIYPPSTAHQGLLRAVVSHTTGKTPGIRELSEWFPISTETFKKNGNQINVGFGRLYQPNEGDICQLTNLWNEVWNNGIKDSYNTADKLKAMMSVTDEQMKQMFENSWEHIVVARVGNEIVGAIWGNQVHLPKGPSSLVQVDTYDLATAKKTFEKRVLTGNSKLCVSVAVRSKYNGYLSGKKSIGERLVEHQFWLAIPHPYLTDVYAYSRLSTLGPFVGTLLMIKDEMGYEIFYGQRTEKWFAKKATGETAPVKIEIGKITVAGETISWKDKRIWEAIPTLDGFILRNPEDHSKFLWLGIDSNRIFDGKTGRTLVKFTDYRKAKYDQMVEFHQGLGANIVRILPFGRRHPEYPELGHPNDLGTNVVLRYDLTELTASKRYFIGAYETFTDHQKSLVVLSLGDPDWAMSELSLFLPPYPDAFRSRIVDGFGIEKALKLVNFIQANQLTIRFLMRFKA